MWWFPFVNGDRLIEAADAKRPAKRRPGRPTTNQADPGR